jgi:hypothetical protein
MNLFDWPNYILFKFLRHDQRLDCPHFNVDGDGKCNLLVEPSECQGYCRTLKVVR